MPLQVPHFKVSKEHGITKKVPDTFNYKTKRMNMLMTKAKDDKKNSRLIVMDLREGSHYSYLLKVEYST